MKQYSIGAIAKLTGLTVHNLRVWEKRHSAIETDRSDSGRRIYSESALERLKLLKSCVDNGFNIGTIAGMSNEELRDILQEFKSADEPTAKKPNLTVWAAGAEALRMIDQLEKPPFPIDKVTRFTDTDHLASAHNGGQPDMLVIEQASLSAAEAQNLGKLIKRINAPYVILLYRYSRQQDVSYLKSLGVQALKSPVDKTTFRDLTANLVEAPQGDPILVPIKQVPPRTFSDRALNKAAAMTSTIDCECPNHLSELIKSLVGFENYSAECESKDKESADLHHHIYLRTAQARAILEDLLQSVLDQEGIDLSRVNH
ncbi:MAG: MerR family transcriptional regulator [Pseudomonadales bacterium]|nr:MerR family transcriptional regulator [Pseudomonadales bacterium]